MPVRRYDLASPPSRKPELLPNGFLKADAVLTRVGVFTYRLADGTTRRELRLPEEVFKADSMASFEMLPVTDDHPPVMVTADNATLYQRGNVGNDIRRDGDLLCGSVMVTDKALVKQITSGKKDQLSNGYDCDLEMTPGTHADYGAYDAIQRNIVGNHVAVVKDARAGPVARVRMDGDAVLVADAAPDPAKPMVQPNPERPVQPGHEPSAEPRLMDKITIDGIECTTPEQVREILARRDARVQAAHDAALSAERKLRTDAETALVTAKTDLEKSKGREDGIKAELEKSEKARKDAEDPKRMDAAVQARVAIVSKAQRVLGADAKLDGLDEAAINKLMLEKLQPGVKLDGKDGGYISGRLDAALESFDGEHPTEASLRAEVEREDKAHRDGGGDPDKARKDHEEHLDSLAKNYRPAFSSRPAPKA